jgi:hypothetical protein
MYETESLANVEAYRDHIRLQRAPVVWRGRIKELETIILVAKLDLEDEGLINVS